MRLERRGLRGTEASRRMKKMPQGEIPGFVRSCDRQLPADWLSRVLPLRHYRPKEALHEAFTGTLILAFELLSASAAMALSVYLLPFVDHKVSKYLQRSGGIRDNLFAAIAFPVSSLATESTTGLLTASSQAGLAYASAL